MKEKLTIAGVVIALVLGVVGLFGGDNVYPTTEKVGVAAGPDHYDGTNYFYDGIADASKNGCFATSTASSGAVDATLTAAQMGNFNCFELTNNSQTNQSITLPASSTMISLFPKRGMHRTWIFENSTTTAANTLTLLKGTGINLIGVSNANDVIDGTERSRLECWKKSNTDIDCEVSELVDVD